MSDLAATGGVSGPGQIGRVAIGDILRRTARRHPNRICVTDGARRVTYAEIERDANRFANALIARGLKPGDKVSTFTNNSADMVKALFGMHRAGLVWVPINTMLPPHEVDYILDHAGVRFALIDDYIYAQPPQREMLQKRGLDLMGVNLAGQCAALGLSEFNAALEGQSENEPDVEIGDRDLAMIIYTSGTTSRPKGAMHGHLAVVMAAMSNAVERMTTRDDGITGQLPLFHCAGHILLLTQIVIGAKMALMRGFDPLVAMETIQREKLKTFVGLPLMYQAILDHPKRAEYDLTSLELCIYAMAPMGRPMLERIVAEMCPNVVLSSGQTEMYPATTMSQPDRALARFGNYWGESLLINESAIMDDEGNILPVNTVGELVHRGPNVMLGYYKDAASTVASRKFGWHHTGDLALIDEHGEILFIDRKKDIIKTGGENVPSVKIEETLLAHPAVMNAAVVGLPHKQWGEAVSAFVTLKPGAEASEDDIAAFCRDRLGGFQAPKLVRILAAMPTTATGKLRKVELRESYRDAFSND